MRMLVLALSGLLLVPHVAAAEQGARLSTETQMLPAISTYSVTLLSGGSTPFTSASGTFTEKSILTCDGWKIEQRLHVGFVQPPAADRRPILPVFLRSGSNMFESADGLTYQFEDRASMGGQTLPGHKGVARLTAPGQGGTVTYAEPAGRTLALPAGTLFPNAFAKAVLETAGSGHTIIKAIVFDGSMDVDKALLNMQAAIDDPREATFKPRVAPQSFQPVPEFSANLAWPVNVAAVPFGASASQPAIQQTYSLLTNGRPETIVLDFSEFQLRLDLTKLEIQQQPSCPP